MTEKQNEFIALEPSYMAEQIYKGVAVKDQFICNPYLIYAYSSVLKAMPPTVFVTITEWLAGINKNNKYISPVFWNTLNYLIYEGELLLQ